MAKLLAASSLSLFFIILLVVAASESEVAEGASCQRRSRRFVGNCLSDDLCNFYCELEGGISGLCGSDGASGGITCFCKFRC